MYDTLHPLGNSTTTTHAKTSGHSAQNSQDATEWRLRRRRKRRDQSLCFRRCSGSSRHGRLQRWRLIEASAASAVVPGTSSTRWGGEAGRKKKNHRIDGGALTDRRLPPRFRRVLNLLSSPPLKGGSKKEGKGIHLKKNKSIHSPCTPFGLEPSLMQHNLDLMDVRILQWRLSKPAAISSHSMIRRNTHPPTKNRSPHLSCTVTSAPRDNSCSTMGLHEAWTAQKKLYLSKGSLSKFKYQPNAAAFLHFRSQLRC